MRNGPGIYLRDSGDWPQCVCNDGRWVIARPVALPSLRQRIVIAWRVFTGQWDALKWDGEP